MNVSAVIVTRGDVDLAPVLDSLPADWQKVVWDNSARVDLSVYGRYAAIAECEHEMIYVQDDDCIVSDPVALAATISWQGDLSKRNFIVANMPQKFRESGFYNDHCLVGFGALFHRDLPAKAFSRFGYRENWSPTGDEIWGRSDATDVVFPDRAVFHRTCDIVFTALTFRFLHDLPYTDREFASAPNRMWKQPQHVEERTRMLELVRKVAA